MVRRRRFSIRPRWALPAGAVIVAGGVLAGTMLASAAAPALPRQTPAQLIASLRHARMPAAFSATLTETANLGIPSLPSIGGLSSSLLSPASLVSGSHTISVWSAGPRHLRIALPVSFGETDLRVNGRQVWLWESQGQKATRIVANGPASGHPARHFMTTGPGMPPKPGWTGQAPGPDWAKLSPLQAAKKALALVGPTTRVTIPGTTSVAGRSTYQLAIAPRTSQSLVGRILIAIDAKTHLPLSVQVFARGSASPAFAIGFTSLSFARPAMSNFTFTPPPGAHVKTMVLPAGRPVASPLPRHAGWSKYPPAGGSGPAARPQTFGTGWLSVVAIPSAGAMASAGPSLPGPPTAVPAKGGSAAYQSSLAISGPAGNGLGILAALLKTAKPVHGAWGSGRLLRTGLVSVLITSKGEVLIGAVTPAVLFADAAKVT
ncbi:MAG: hypothetical protein ACR2FU_03980 [Streptosporangiaceae bacterium]